jgi:hydrogenase-4 component E
MELFQLAASKALASSAAFLLMTVLLMAAAKRISTCIAIFAVQCSIITAEILAIAYVQHSSEALAVALLVFVTKVIAIPSALIWIVREVKIAREVQSSTTPAQSLYITAGLILLAFFAVQPYAKTLRVDENMLAASIALVLTGAFVMVSRKKALMQVVGLLVLENGIFLAALITTFGMPLIIEIGIAFDLLMGVFLMGLFVFRIRDTFEHLDVSKLRRLRG